MQDQDSAVSCNFQQLCGQAMALKPKQEASGKYLYKGNLVATSFGKS